MRDLPEQIKAELAAEVESLVANGVDRGIARQKVWQNYQNELAAIGETMPSVADRAVPELPPPKQDWQPKGTSYGAQDLARNGNKPWYRPRADSENFWTPERKAKNQSELDKLKQQLGIRTCK